MTTRRRRPQRPISPADLIDHRRDGRGNVADTVDVDQASRSLGVSKNAVRQAITDARNSFSTSALRRIAGREEADVSAAASARGLLQAAFGRGPRGGAVDARAAARDLGVSLGTVRRWAAGTQQPAPGRLKSIRDAARRVISTKGGRRRTTSDFRSSAQGRDALQNGTKVWVDGYQGLYDGKSYARDRTMIQDITADEVEQMLRAYEEGGDQGLRDWMKAGPGTKYLQGWEFITIDDFGLGDR